MNELFGLRSLASKIVHSKYLSRWIVLAIDLILSVGVTLFVYFIIMYVTLSPIKKEYVGGLIAWSAVYSLLAFLCLHAYRGVVRHTTLQETWRIGVAIILKVVLLYFTIHWIVPEVSINRLLLGGIIALNFSAVVLVSLRVVIINV